MSAARDIDVLIIGSGLMGSAVANRIRAERPSATVLMVDGGPRLGSLPGQHLHDVPEPAIWARYNDKVSSGIQGFYTSTKPTQAVTPAMVDVEPGMYRLDSLGQVAHDMPGAAVAWNVGGMGVHWTAATPTPWGREVFPFLDAEEWSRDLAVASSMLRINTSAFPLTTAGERVMDVAHRLFDSRSAPSRQVQPMPMAVTAMADGSRPRTGPNTIFPPIADPTADDHFEFHPSTLALRLIHTDGDVAGAWVRDVPTGQEREILARTTVVCADTIRTPQLLWASGIRPPALGRYLNEHAFLTGRVLADPSVVGFELDDLKLAVDTEFAVDFIWLPHSDAAQPNQIHFINTVMFDDDLRPLAYAVGLEIYVPTEVRPENRLEFSDESVDTSGMPRITVHFSYSDADRRDIEAAQRMQSEVASHFGNFDPDSEAAVLEPGSSLHFTGTVRMGTDPQTSVCGSDCRVWGMSNLFVAGNGVVPTALACNSTLIGMTTAVRASRAVVNMLG